MFCSGRRALVACVRFLRAPRADFSSIPDLAGLSLVRSVDKVIDRSSNIFVESPIHVRVLPVNVEDAANHDKLTMQLFSRETSPGDFNVKQSSKRLELVNTASQPDSSDVCVLRVPLHLSVHVIAINDACVDVHNILAEDVNISTQNGSVHIGDVQARSIKVESAEGIVRGDGRLQAELIDIKTGVTSGVECKNILSNDLKVTTHAGPIKVESCYSKASHFTTALGDIILHHLHRSCIIDIIQKGSLRVLGLEGQLQASLKSGDVFLHASKITDRSSIFIHEKGHVEMKISDMIKDLTVINLIGGKINIEDEIKKLGRYMDDSHPQRFRYPLKGDEDNASELHVECRNGVIELKKSDTPFLLKSV